MMIIIPSAQIRFLSRIVFSFRILTRIGDYARRDFFLWAEKHSPPEKYVARMQRKTAM